MAFSLQLLGGVVLSGEDGPLTGPPVQRHRLALLALIAIARQRGLRRDKAMSLLWPERDAEHARNLLNQAVHALRRSLGADAIRSTSDELRLDSTLVACDVTALEDALSAQQLAHATTLYTGPLLDGFFLEESAEFERWVARERDRLESAIAKSLETLATTAESEGDFSAALTWWRRRSELDVFDSRVAMHVMRALERTGNRAGALQYARRHTQALQKELDIEADPEFLAYAERLRRAPSSGVMSVPTEDTLNVARSSVASHASQSDALRDAALNTSMHGPPDDRDVPIRRQRTRLLAYGAIGLMVTVGATLWVRHSLSASTELAPATAAGYRSTSIAAHEMVVRGNDPVLLRSDSGARRGVEYFRRATQLDSMYAEAWVGLARMLIRSHGDAVARERAQALADADVAIRKAIALNDSLAEAHAVLGLLRGMELDTRAVEEQLLRATALAPSNGQLREWLASYYIYVERPADALREAERARAIDPLSPSATAEVARALVANERCDEATVLLDNIRSVQPPLLRVAPTLAECLSRQERWDDAIAVLQPQAENNEVTALALIGYLHARAGRRKAAQSVQRTLMQRWRAGHLGSYYLAFVPVGLSDQTQAFYWLDKAVADGSLSFFPGRRPGLKDPPFERLRDDARMLQLRRRLGIASQ